MEIRIRIYGKRCNQIQVARGVAAQEKSLADGEALAKRTELIGLQNDGSGDHVVQRLLAFGKCRHDEADQQRHAGNDFREEAAGGARERDALSVEVGNFESHGHLANRRLAIGAQQVRLVEPRDSETRECQHEGVTHHGDDQRWIGFAIAVAHGVDNDVLHDEHEERYGDDSDDDSVDDQREKAHPESTVAGRTRRKNRDGMGRQWRSAVSADLRVRGRGAAALAAIKDGSCSCIRHGFLAQVGLRGFCHNSVSRETQNQRLILHDDRIGHHVVQRLSATGEGSDDESEETDERREEFRKMAGAGLRETDLASARTNDPEVEAALTVG